MPDLAALLTTLRAILLLELVDFFSSFIFNLLCSVNSSKADLDFPTKLDTFEVNQFLASVSFACCEQVNKSP